MSPVFHRENGYVFKVFSNEEDRKHIHVMKAECEAKFWLEPEVEMEKNEGFDSKELKFIRNILIERGDELREKYSLHIGKRIND